MLGNLTDTKMILDDKDGTVLYHPHLVAKEVQDFVIEHFINNSEWEQDEYNFGGKIVKSPRLTSFYGYGDYLYSAQLKKAKPFCNRLEYIRKWISELCEYDFNCCLLNYYRDGNDSIHWHSDNEPEMGDVIASLSFGAERLFKLKHNKTHEVKQINLNSGSLLVMMNGLQKNWKHAIPKQKEITQARLNMTFRKTSKNAR